jgi:hypothetical protein
MSFNARSRATANGHSAERSAGPDHLSARGRVLRSALDVRRGAQTRARNATRNERVRKSSETMLWLIGIRIAKPCISSGAQKRHRVPGQAESRARRN